MRVVLPFTKLKAGVRVGVYNTGRQWSEVYVGGSDESYWNLLNTLWQDQKDFVVIEHDVCVLPDTIDQLEQCSSPWCGFRIEYMDGAYAGLGCTKFTGAIMSAVPNALEQEGQMSDPTHSAKHWCRIDGWLQVILQQAGHHMHIHDGLLKHVRPDNESPWPSHGCQLPPR